jgi:arylsulfatase A-like enzyme
LVPAIVVAFIALLRGSVWLGLPIGLLSFVGFFEVSARLPLEVWASFLVSGGLAAQTVRFVRPRRAGFMRFARRTVVLLAGILLLIILVNVGGRALSEYRLDSTMPPAPADARNVLLIVWDTVRASNTSLYGYNRPTTPNLERLANKGVRFNLAFSTSSWTLPSHASLFTGKWPHELGVGWKTPMRDDVPTLAEYLAARGYETSGFVANLDYCSRETGLARGFAHYDDFPIDVYDAFDRYTALGRRIEISSWIAVIDWFLERRTGSWYDLVPRSREHTKNGEAIDRAFLDWLATRPLRGRPFFAFLNYNDAHSPYEVPDPSAPAFGLRPRSSMERQTLLQWTALDKSRLLYDDVRMVNDIYDESIRYLDRRLGMLVDELTRRGVLENTLLIVTSDHGEHLGDHLLFFHGNSLYRQVVQVPLLIVAAKKIPEGLAVAEPVGLGDIPATVIDLLGLGRSRSFPGTSVARYWQPRDPGATVVAQPLLMETAKPEASANEGREPAAKGPMKAVVAAGMHYIRMGDGTEELFNLRSDVEEKSNLAGDPQTLPVLEQFRNILGLMLKKR